MSERLMRQAVEGAQERGSRDVTLYVSHVDAVLCEVTRLRGRVAQLSASVLGHRAELDQKRTRIAELEAKCEQLLDDLVEAARLDAT